MSFTTFNGSVLGAEYRVPEPFLLAKRQVVCVTGGSGFVGSHLCERLVRSGHRVVAIDNFHTGRRANVQHLQIGDRFTLVEHDVVDPFPNDLPRFDAIYNLAGPASPPHSQSDPLKTLSICSLGSLHALQRAERDGARLFHASTSEIYGDPEVHPQVEGYFGNVNTLGPRACYDEGKRFAETLAYEYSERRGVDVRMARIFNTYGPRMQPDDGRVVSNFIIQALQGDDLTIYGDGGQTRSFCFVDDLVDGIVRLMTAPERPPHAVNLGNPAEITVRDLAQRVLEMTGSSSRIVEKPLPQDDPKRRRPDISQARDLLRWEPCVPLADGLRLTIDYFDRQLRSGDYHAGLKERRFTAPPPAAPHVAQPA